MRPNRFVHHHCCAHLQHYLLVDDDLVHHSDGTGLRHVERKNPMNEHWSQVKLFLRCQVHLPHTSFLICPVESLSYGRHGTQAGLEAELERRDEESRRRKQVKYTREIQKGCVMDGVGVSLDQMRKQTITSTWLKPQEAAHDHIFEASREVCYTHDCSTHSYMLSMTLVACGSMCVQSATSKPATRRCSHVLFDT